MQEYLPTCTYGAARMKTPQGTMNIETGRRRSRPSNPVVLEAMEREPPIKLEDASIPILDASITTIYKANVEETESKSNES